MATSAEHPVSAPAELDPAHLTPEMGINRVVIETFADSPIRDLAGTRASNLLSSVALSAVDAAEAGRRLAALIATLKDDRTARHQSTSDERRAALDRWRAADPIIIGGGTAARYGDELVDAARATLRKLRPATPAVSLGPHAAVLTLVGLARAVDRADGDLLVDFGHSLVKRARARVENRRCRRLELLPPVPVPSGLDPADGMEFVVSTLADSVAATEVPSVDVAIASYIVHGGVVANFSIYTTLQSADFVSRALSGAIRRDIGVALHHDGTAAARAVPEHPRAGVIMMGTSLGAGFPPLLDTVAPLASDFSVS